MTWVYGWLAVGLCFAAAGAVRGLYDAELRTVTVLHKDGRRETKETRGIPDLIVTLALTVVAWPIFPGYAIYQLVVNPIRRRRFERTRPDWLGR